MSRCWMTVGAAVATTLSHIALASEEAHHNGGGAHGGGFGDLLFPTINFAIFVWMIWTYALPAMRGWVRERHDRVVRELAEAAAAKAEAERLRQEWQDRIARLDETIAQMREQARQDAQRERDRILAAALKAAEGIRRDAERAAAYEVRRAQQQLRAELVQQALALAEDTTRKQWSEQDQERAVTEFLKQVRE
jgi:F-type H+-transporting ATPase subunit b